MELSCLIKEIIMRNGICPKCNATEVYHSFSKKSLDSGLKTGDGGPMVGFHKVGKGVFGDGFANITLEAYLCRKCGYVEMYVPEADLEQMSLKLAEAANWNKVDPA
jgi:predicted nucleic-acid-binding Zn-ribbon protein